MRNRRIEWQPFPLHAQPAHRVDRAPLLPRALVFLFLMAPILAIMPLSFTPAPS